MSKFTDLVSGGESTELMNRYLSTRPTLKQQLSRNLVNEDNARKLTTLKNNYLVVMPQMNRFNRICDAQRDNMLMLLNGILSKEEMLSCGSTVGPVIYQNMRSHVNANGMVVKWPDITDNN